ncbi:MAG: DsrE family protein [Candidatus Riflebacteria bacterium]|nr:DsrE family protein [Candidatus Riflebacteria bacterium]
MSGKFCVVLGSGPDNWERATIAFVTANAALAVDKETTVFMNFEGVRLSQKGQADGVHVEPSEPLANLMEAFVAGGGKIVVCSRCFTRRKLDPENLVPGAVLAGAPKLVEILGDGTPSVSY